MAYSWGPSGAGKLFTTTPQWSLTFDGDSFTLNIAGLKSVTANLLRSEEIEIKPGVVWSCVQFPYGPGKVINLDGIPNEEATWMLSVLSNACVEFKRKAQVQKFLKNLTTSLQPAVQWADDATTSCKSQLKSHGWLTTEFSSALEKSKPSKHLEAMQEPEVVEYLINQPEIFQSAIRIWTRETSEFTSAINERLISKELVDSKSFFDAVEKSPLTQEQARAVICFDNRILLVASAGSGKTSTIVAKAGYALMKGYVQPEQMLILTFNNVGAAELRERVKARLSKLALPYDKIVVRTFHAFGLEVIGAATGKKPSLAPWLENGDDLRALVESIEKLKVEDPGFRATWGLFRFVLGQDLPAFGKEAENPDSWDAQTRSSGFLTLNNEIVKSRGEQLIANWLFYNGVRYKYEAKYKVQTVDPTHRQYQPDFYLPDIDAYLEHWALDEHGNPPKSFHGYLDGMKWKKQLHEANGTTLLETTVAGLWSGAAFDYLERELTKRGIELQPDPERPVPGRKPIDNHRLARTFRSFLTHVKSNRLMTEQLNKRLSLQVSGPFKFRHMLFIKLFERIYAAWEARLSVEDCIDFEDMLNQAADHIENGTWTGAYKVVMVDEFQDSSQARARIAAALVAKPGRCLFAVGDDWQSINRFAGADINVMTDFESRYGKSKVMKLESTFRCPQSLCNVSSEFIQKNPKQLTKTVSAVNHDVDEPIRIVRVDDEGAIQAAIRGRIAEIAAQSLASGKTFTSIYVLGRYQKDSVFSPPNTSARDLSIEFMTVHSSKGLEADHVILPRLTSGVLGFPSRVTDDPVLQLAMPEGDGYEYGEERRLFYVALTRAKQSVTIVTLANKESPFVHELAGDYQIPIGNLDGSNFSSERCSCGNGFFVKRKGEFGQFYGCSTFPSCSMTKQFIEKTTAPQEYEKSPSPDMVAPTEKPVSVPSALSPTPAQVPAEIELIGFKVTHRTLGTGIVVRVREASPKNYIVIQYDSGGESEYGEDIFTGWGDYFTHSGSAALMATRAYSKKSLCTNQLHQAATPVDRDELIQERHRLKVVESGKQYMGVRPVRKGRFNRVAKCYACKSPLDNSINMECSSCGWILCSCGACGCGYAF
ncbi:UvrD-helicase domain-containing protein [Polaromonas sp. DSR2-3-2]|uniref:UvrD-helicase domain-containing protein n=1 Tax=unclassified Polaromonas TaxID=2638319 RepID=UPI003CEC0814